MERETQIEVEDKETENPENDKKSSIKRHKRTRQRLRESEEHIKLIADNSPDYIFQINTDGKVIYSSPAVKKILGYEPEERQKSSFTDLVIPEDIAGAQTLFKKVMKGQEIRNLEINLLNKNNKAVPVEVNVVPIMKNDKVNAVFGIARDIRGRKKIINKLKNANRRISDSNEELEYFTHIIAHDLQEPLRVISCYLQLIELRYKRKIDEKTDECLNYTVNEARRIKEMVNDLLEFTQIGKADVKKSTITDCNSVMSHVINNLKVTIREYGVEITHGDLPSIKASRAKLIHLLQNLISNSIKYRSDTSLKIHISVIKNNSEWVFSIQDNGMGFKQHYKDKIFKVFQKLENGERYSGTGMGLAACKRIVDSFDGRIWAESELGKGSTFYFTIPV
ncbi:ATP-binding protein [Elusimicrobiota bacterium]